MVDEAVVGEATVTDTCRRVSVASMAAVPVRAMM